MNQKVSIIMPAYNAGKYIAESIESILAQTYTNWELVVMDDESIDNTATIVKHYQQADSRIKYFWQKNSKQGKSRNRAIEKSDGAYIAFLDADDVWLPEKLMNQVRLIEEKKIDIVFGYAYLIENGNKTLNITGRGNGFYQGKKAVDFFLYHDALVISTTLVTRRAIEQVGCFVEDLKIQYCEDWHIWLKLAIEGFSFYTDANVVSFYRIHEASAAKTEKQEQVKFFFALLDLHYKYQDNDSLRAEVARRTYQLIYHSRVLTKFLIENIVEFLKRNRYSKFLSPLYKPLFSLNQLVFRKFFLFMNKKLKGEKVNVVLI